MMRNKVRHGENIQDLLEIGNLIGKKHRIIEKLAKDVIMRINLSRIGNPVLASKLILMQLLKVLMLMIISTVSPLKNINI